MTAQPIVSTNYFLVIALYNHGSKKSQDKEGTGFLGLSEDEKRAAKLHARSCFGYRLRNNDTGQVEGSYPNEEIGNDFMYLGYFPYHYISNPDENHADRGTYLYGWTAILKGEKLSQIMSSSEFLRMYEIEVFNLDQAKMVNLLDFISKRSLQKSETLWKTRGLDVYDDQTPRMWTPG